MKIKKGFLHHQCTFVLFLRLVCLEFPLIPPIFLKSRSLCCPSLGSSLDITFKASVKLKLSPGSPLTPQKYFTLEVSSWSPFSSWSLLHYEEDAV